jgi:N-acylneuraminate cytidylyltransferase/CMP-N,N'-diacetyllegionaminic acid synthase
MNKSNKILAIIPARGGSKGIPQKNIRLLNNKPLIAYTIEEAMKSKLVDRVIVSTENEEIYKISKQYGAELPFMRPVEFAQDSTPGIDPILHCIKWMEINENYVPDYVVCLQCTSPFRRAEQIDEALKRIIEEDADSLVSLREIEENPYWMKKLVNGKMQNFLENIELISRRQELPPVYLLNGAIYIAKTESLLKNGNWYADNTIPYIMDKISSTDIDDILDFQFAEFLMKENINEHHK